MKYRIIVKDSVPSANAKALADAELLEQFETCLDICIAILDTNIDQDDENKELYDYCTTRLGDLVDYLLELLNEYIARGGDKLTDEQIKAMKRLQKNIKMKSNHLVNMYKSNHIDWDFIQTIGKEN